MASIDKLGRAVAAVAASATDAAFISAGGSGMKVIVTQLVIVNGATGTSTLQLNTKGSSAGTTLFPASLVLAASAQLVLPYSDGGWFTSNPGEGITISTGAGNTTNAFFIASYRYS